MRKKRIDMSLSMTQLVKLLDLDVSDGGVERWEKNYSQPRTRDRQRVIEFLGYDPAITNPTGDS